MLNEDLALAKIDYRDASGLVADFHSLRHSYISMVVRSGASVKTAQELARHSTATLTIGVYARASLLDVTGALDALPNIEPIRPKAEAMKATGTDPLAGGRAHTGATVEDVERPNVLRCNADTETGKLTLNQRVEGSSPSGGICDRNRQ
jgi:hypothetical protein